MKKRFYVAVSVLIALLLLTGCSVFSSHKDVKSLKEMVGTTVNDEYVMGEISGLLPEGTFQSFGCYRVGNTVVASARYYDLTNESTNIECFQLPEGFWPRVKTTCNGYIIVNDTSIPVFLNIDTKGVVSVEYSNNIKMSQVFFSATFPS